jgi:1,2-diacylglycerol-3-alpha-glucose alpha-1,2-galactosyltransferase
VKQIQIGVLSKATSVPGQGVGSAYIEQLKLIQSSTRLNILRKPSSKVDVYHVHTINFRYYLTLLFTKKPTVVYVHFLPTTLENSIRLPKVIFNIFKWYVKSFYKRADHLVVVNPIFIDPLVALNIPRDRLTFIPNYVDPDNFKIPESKSQLKKRYQLPRFTVLGVGQVQHRKGILDFVKVANKLPNIDFIWAGGFSFKEITAGYQQLKDVMDNPPHNLKFLGIIPRNELMEYYKAADLFFLPSLDELMPMSVLEAAVLQCPILLRDLPLYEPVFFDQFLKSKSVDGFVSIIHSLSTDASAYEASLAHPKWIVNHYKKSAILAQWESFYEEVKHRGKTH